MERIETQLLIPGDGEPVRDAVLLADDATIRYAGPADGAPSAPGAKVTTAAVVMPGMWDCHGHFLGSRSFDLTKLVQEPVALRAARSARDLANALTAGITSVREVGGLGIYLARAVTEGLLPGPSIYAAGAILSTTGGHGDLHCYPLSWVEDVAREDGSLRLADGEAECMRAVREQLRRGARVIKVCASGGVLSELDDPIHQQFTGGELRVIVEVAATGRPRGGCALPRQARHHGRDRGRRGHDRARELSRRRGVRRDARDRHDPGAHQEHHRRHPEKY